MHCRFMWTQGTTILDREVQIPQQERAFGEKHCKTWIKKMYCAKMAESIMSRFGQQTDVGLCIRWSRSHTGGTWQCNILPDYSEPFLWMLKAGSLHLIAGGRWWMLLLLLLILWTTAWLMCVRELRLSIHRSVWQTLRPRVQTPVLSVRYRVSSFHSLLLLPRHSCK